MASPHPSPDRHRRIRPRPVLAGSLLALTLALTGGVATLAADGARAQTAEDAADAVIPSVDTSREGYEITLPARFTAEQLLDMDVVSTDGDEIGEIEDVLINDDRSIDRAIVEAGGFLGLGERAVAMDLGQMTFDAADDDELIVEMGREEIENLPAYERTDRGWRRIAE